jgi:hypothetical protein
MVGERVAVVGAGAQLGDLAGGPAHRVLVALAARLGVVDRPQAVGHLLDLVEHGAVGVHLRLGLEAVRLVVEAGRRLGRVGRRGIHHRSRQQQDHHRIDETALRPSLLHRNILRKEFGRADPVLAPRSCRCCLPDSGSKSRHVEMT